MVCFGEEEKKLILFATVLGISRPAGCLNKNHIWPEQTPNTSSLVEFQESQQTHVIELEVRQEK
jgi:outer membrane murein-binding lipoprotein Lpp